MSSDHDKKPLISIDPKELTPAGVGLVLGVLLLIGFFGLAVVLGMPTIVESWDIPKQ